MLFSVVFRADASLEIGTGHVMRCLTLADALRERGANCLFACRPHAGHLIDEIERRGHRVVRLSAPSPVDAPATGDLAHASWLGAHWEQDAQDTLEGMEGQQADWLIVDHYALDMRWEKLLRPACRRIMVMDDLADREHDCDLLLDPTLGRSKADYSSLIPPGAEQLLGPKYALLRPEFAALRAESLARRESPQLRHLLITMGGVDKDNITSEVLDGLDACPLPPGTRITVVMGRQSPWLSDVKTRAGRMRFTTEVRVDVRDMARLMTDSDLAIGASGGTSWERCCLGLPAFVLALANNQLEIAKSLENAGAIIATSTPVEAVEGLAKYIAADEGVQFLAGASLAAAQITDGLGTERLCQEMCE